MSCLILDLRSAPADYHHTKALAWQTNFQTKYEEDFVKSELTKDAVETVTVAGLHDFSMPSEGG